jgi:hypothetical protein
VTNRCCPAHASFLSSRTDNSCLPPLRTSVTCNGLRHPFPLAAQCLSTLYLERREFALGVINYLDCTMPFGTEICKKRRRFGTPLYSTNRHSKDRTATRPAGAAGLCVRSSYKRTQFNRVKKNQLDAQLILSIFRQAVHVSGVSRPIIWRYNRMYEVCPESIQPF